MKIENANKCGDYKIGDIVNVCAVGGIPQIGVTNCDGESWANPRTGMSQSFKNLGKKEIVTTFLNGNITVK